MRFVAPAAFLLAVTVAVLLIRSGLDVGDSRATTRTTSTKRTATTPATTPTTKKPARAVRKRYYVIRSGDTFELIAIRFDTSVDRLVVLNPGVEPTSLTPGQRVRIA